MPFCRLVVECQYVPLPRLEPRLQRRYLKMVESHQQATHALASGIHAVPDANTAFAATQAYRFLNNDRVTLRALAEPLIEAARSEAAVACDQWGLVVHDWSQLMYPEHESKQDRVALSSRKVPDGYELQSALLVSDRDGSPLSPLDELDPAMRYVESLSLGRPLVHIIDTEADLVGHFRQWSDQPDRYYLVRADDRIVEWQGEEHKCSAIQQKLHKQGEFRLVAEVPVRLLRAAQRNRPKAGDRRRIPGPPLPLRLVFVEVRDDTGKVLATWRLLTNLPTDVAASRVALWYYWRWNIETFFKLLKSFGVHIEQWQQVTAHAIAARLLVASMACVAVWRIVRSQHPQADHARKMLVRLSGRQMKRSKPFTTPALLAGMWSLLAMIAMLEEYSLEQIRDVAQLVSANPRPP